MQNDGGPAFPFGFVTDHATVKVQDGMSLRDWFAGMALQGLIVGCYAGVEGNVVAAYEYADAMLAERTKST